jgi:sec-independent protein translocase protein TatC
MDNEKTIPFLEHLVELRRRLIIVIVAITIGMGVSWNYSGTILTFIEKPLTGKTYLTEIKKTVYLEVKKRAPFLYDHYQLEKDVTTTSKERRLNYSAPLEPFFVQCKISMLAGFIIVLPIVFQQVWAFVAPGLTRSEKRLVMPFVTISTLSFCLGALFFLIIIWPVIINFSLSYELEGLQSWFNLSLYVNFCLRLVLVFGLIFELPIIALLLNRFGIVNYAFLAKHRRFALLASAIIAAFHADLITMFVIMVPLYLMYEFSIWAVYFLGRRPKAVA